MAIATTGFTNKKEDTIAISKVSSEIAAIREFINPARAPVEAVAMFWKSDKLSENSAEPSLCPEK